MAAGNPISGKNGTVKTGGTPTALVHITNWKITRSAETDRFADNSSSGWKRSIAGTKMWEGSFDGKVNDGEAVPLKEGDGVAAQFHLDGSGGQHMAGNITVKSLDVECDFDTGKVIAYSVKFEGNGALTDTGDYLTA